MMGKGFGLGGLGIGEFGFCIEHGTHSTPTDDAALIEAGGPRKSQ